MMLALSNYSGTAIPETGICENCYQDEHNRQTMRRWAFDIEDYVDGSFDYVTGNTEIECQFCGITSKDNGIGMYG